MQKRHCKSCDAILSKNCKGEYCSKHRDRTGKNNPFFGKKHSKETVDLIKEKNRKTSTDLWKDSDYREKVIKGTSKPRSDDGKANISLAVTLSYMNNPELRNHRRDTMIRRIDEGFDPGNGRYLSGTEGWGVSSYVNGIYCESKLEAKRVSYLIENDIKVEKWKSKEDQTPIPYFDSERELERRYFPDYIIDNNRIEEIKYLHECKNNLVKDKYKFAYSYYKKLGVLYYIVTEKDYNKSPDEVYNSKINCELRNKLNLS